MSALDRKLGRDLWRLKGQVATIALVLACGIMAMIMLRSTWQSLLEARDAYYEQYRFGDVFAHLERAPDAALPRIERLPGVALAYPRVVEDVMAATGSKEKAQSDVPTSNSMKSPCNVPTMLRSAPLRSATVWAETTSKP